LVLAVALAVAAGLAARAWLRNQEAELIYRERNMTIVSAARPLRKGDVIRRDDLRAMDFPERRVVGGMIPFAEQRLVVGRVLTIDVDANAPVFKQFLDVSRDKPVHGESLVAPGRRAVTLRVNAEASNAFMIRPGDYVDIVGTFDTIVRELPPERRPADASPDARVTTTLRLLEAVKVLAVDNRTVKAADQRQGGTDRGYRTITLEMEPDNAGRMIAAENRGKLTFLLRAHGDVGQDGEALRPYPWQELRQELRR
jgi:pilus assembly protein CpaB